MCEPAGQTVEHAAIMHAKIVFAAGAKKPTTMSDGWPDSTWLIPSLSRMADLGPLLGSHLLRLDANTACHCQGCSHSLVGIQLCRNCIYDRKEIVMDCRLVIICDNCW